MASSWIVVASGSGKREPEVCKPHFERSQAGVEAAAAGCHSKTQPYNPATCILDPDFELETNLEPPNPKQHYSGELQPPMTSLLWDPGDVAQTVSFRT